jgi:DNA modification methylase
MPRAGISSEKSGQSPNVDHALSPASSSKNVCAKCGAEFKTVAHPTCKPHDLMTWLVKLVTPPNGLVLDPFCGSGSTGVAALAEGFHFVGIDSDPDYCAISRARIANVAPLFNTEEE